MTLILFLISVNSCYFLKLSPGVMSQGLGGASIMNDEGLSAFHNPAYIQNTKFNFTVSRWLYSTNLFSLGASFNENCIGLSYLNYGSIQGYNEYGLATNKFNPFNICLAIGRRLGPLGVSIKVFSEKIDSYALYGICGGTSMYLDFGKIAIGAKVDNLGKEFGQDSEIPFIIGMGLKITLPKNFDILIESKMPDLEINSGLLYSYQNINLLFGIKYLKAEASNPDISFSDLNFSGGIIIQVENYNIGYSLMYTQFSMAHQFSIIFIP